MITGRTWKMTQEKNADECVYRLQVNGVTGVRERNKVEKAMSGWIDAGGGYNPRTQEEILFFKRGFDSVESFVIWGKNFQEFPLVELDKNGDVKTYVRIGPTIKHRQSGTSAKSQKKTPSRREYRCGKCGEIGHNGRTCSNMD